MQKCKSPVDISARVCYARSMTIEKDVLAQHRGAVGNKPCHGVRRIEASRRIVPPAPPSRRVGDLSRVEHPALGILGAVEGENTVSRSDLDCASLFAEAA